MNFKEQLLRCLGGDWPAPCPLSVEVEDSQQADGFLRKKVRYTVEPGERVSGYLLLPDSITPEKKAAAICVWHQHAGQWHLGKSEPAGLSGAPMHHTGVALAREGYVVFCPDAWGFEEREYGYSFKGKELERFLFLQQVVAGRSMAWKNILDMRRAVDLVVSLAEVDGERVGCYGHSMGSTHTWLVGAWEPRIKALVGNCCLPTYAGIAEKQLLHCFANFIPGLEQFGDTPDIAALIAPRPLHLNFGELDDSNPISHVRSAVKKIELAYGSANAQSNFTHFIQKNVGHVLSPQMWQRTKTFFSQHLR